MPTDQNKIRVSIGSLLSFWADSPKKDVYLYMQYGWTNKISILPTKRIRKRSLDSKKAQEIYSCSGGVPDGHLLQQHRCRCRNFRTQCHQIKVSSLSNGVKSGFEAALSNVSDSGTVVPGPLIHVCVCVPRVLPGTSRCSACGRRVSLGSSPGPGNRLRGPRSHRASSSLYTPCRW